MKTLKPFLVILAILLVSSKVFSQGMIPPAPIKAPIFDAISGTWNSEAYEMMGSKMTDVVSQGLILNGQFFEIKVKSVSVGFTYEAEIIIAPAEDGTLTGWSYDIFGKNAITTYSGYWNDKQISVDGRSSMGTESRVIVIENGIMLQSVTFKMQDAKGNKLPEESFTITYNKK